MLQVAWALLLSIGSKESGTRGNKDSCQVTEMARVGVDQCPEKDGLKMNPVMPREDRPRRHSMMILLVPLLLLNTTAEAPMFEESSIQIGIRFPI